MSQDTSIEWTDRSSNPIKARRKSDGKRGWHCTKISPGCANCYSEGLDRRFGTGIPYSKAGGSETELYLDEAELSRLLKLRKPQRVFLCDMTDLFHEDVPDAWLDRIFATIAACPHLTFQILTKRAERMRNYTTQRYMPGRLNDARVQHQIAFAQIMDWPLRNVWLGVSVEDQARKVRIDELRHCPAVIRFLSLEPLLEDLGKLDLVGISWGILGGESGRGARLCHTNWIRSAARQCIAASVPVFVKQLGANVAGTLGDQCHKEHPHVPGIWGAYPLKLKDRKGGNPEEWPADLRIREFPTPTRSPKP